MKEPSFSERVKRHQLSWALDNRITPEMLEVRKGKPSWVLSKEHKKQNLYDHCWWRFLQGKEHRWSRALNSSQCFAVNLFAPLASDDQVARRFWDRFVPHRHLDASQKVGVIFEHTPRLARDWLGEKRRQSTQVDVYLTVQQDGWQIGHLLVEVKFSEAEFGSCRGAVPSTSKRQGNLHPDRCMDIQAILGAPGVQCWLVEEKKRRYWDYLTSPNSSISLDELKQGPCPFRQGLYQIMRNRLLADALVVNGNAWWADVAVCIHPGNDAVRRLREPVGGETDAVAAINKLIPHGKILDLNPVEIVSFVAEEDHAWRDWGAVMRARYCL